MRKIRIAQIGVNQHSHGREIFYTLKKMPEIFEVVGYTLVEDEEETCKDQLYIFEGYPRLTLDEILNDPTIEAVTIETDEIHLTKYALLAAKRGKHIHMEKPGGAELDEFEKLIELVKGGDKVFHIGYMYRYNPYIKEALDRAKSGELGEIFSVEAQMNRLDGSATCEWFGSFKGGMMFYLGCHLIDLILQFQGQPQKIIPLNCSTHIDGVDTEDFAMAVFEYPNGRSFIKVCGREVGGYERRQLVICGSKGTIEIRPLEATGKGIKYSIFSGMREAIKDEQGHTSHQSKQSDEFDRYQSMLTAFSEMVRGEKKNPYTTDYELELYRTLIKCCNV